MKRRICTMIALLVILICAACGQQIPTWQEQYDLGVRYLEEGNYEEAIIAFTAAIEIDSKQPAAYIGLADLYAELGNYAEADDVVDRGIEACGRLEELVFLQNMIFRDSQENYSINMPIAYTVVHQEGDAIQIESISYEVEKKNNKYKGYCRSRTEDGMRTIYGTLWINGIKWDSGNRVYVCWPADSAQNEDILIAAPLEFSETYCFKQLELEFEQYFDQASSDGNSLCSSGMCGIKLPEDNKFQYTYTIHEILTTSNYMTIALYNKSGVRTGLLVMELQPSAEVLEMLAKHTVMEKMETSE